MSNIQPEQADFSEEHTSLLGDDLRQLPTLFKNAERQIEAAQKIREATIQDKAVTTQEALNWAVEELDLAIFQIRNILVATRSVQAADWIKQLAKLSQLRNTLFSRPAQKSGDYILSTQEQTGICTLEHLQELRELSREGYLQKLEEEIAPQKTEFLREFNVKAEAAARNYCNKVSFELTNPDKNVNPKNWARFVGPKDDALKFSWLQEAGYKPQIEALDKWELVRLKIAGYTPEIETLLKPVPSNCSGDYYRYFISVSLVKPTWRDKLKQWLSSLLA